MSLGEQALIVASILFVLGAIGVIVRRNFLFVLMSIEIMLNASGLAFVAGSNLHGKPEGYIFYIFILPVAAAEVAIGLALALLMYQKFKTLDLFQIADAGAE